MAKNAGGQGNTREELLRRSAMSVNRVGRKGSAMLLSTFEKKKNKKCDIKIEFIKVGSENKRREPCKFTLLLIRNRPCYLNSNLPKLQ